MFGRLHYHRAKNSIAPWIRIRTIKAAHRGAADRGEHRRAAGVGNKVPQEGEGWPAIALKACLRNRWPSAPIPSNPLIGSTRVSGGGARSEAGTLRNATQLKRRWQEVGRPQIITTSLRHTSTRHGQLIHRGQRGSCCKQIMGLSF
jgi:hypothetical protein